jgi:hypothetical protein
MDESSGVSMQLSRMEGQLNALHIGDGLGSEGDHEMAVSAVRPGGDAIDTELCGQIIDICMCRMHAVLEHRPEDVSPERMVELVFLCVVSHWMFETLIADPVATFRHRSIPELKTVDMKDQTELCNVMSAFHDRTSPNRIVSQRLLRSPIVCAGSSAEEIQLPGTVVQIENLTETMCSAFLSFFQTCVSPDDVLLDQDWFVHLRDLSAFWVTEEYFFLTTTKTLFDTKQKSKSKAPLINISWIYFFTHVILCMTLYGNCIGAMNVLDEKSLMVLWKILLKIEIFLRKQGSGFRSQYGEVVLEVYACLMIFRLFRPRTFVWPRDQLQSAVIWCIDTYRFTRGADLQEWAELDVGKKCPHWRRKPKNQLEDAFKQDFHIGYCVVLFFTLVLRVTGLENNSKGTIVSLFNLRQTVSYRVGTHHLANPVFFIAKACSAYNGLAKGLQSEFESIFKAAGRVFCKVSRPRCLVQLVGTDREFRRLNKATRDVAREYCDLLLPDEKEQLLSIMNIFTTNLSYATLPDEVHIVRRATSTTPYGLFALGPPSECINVYLMAGDSKCDSTSFVHRGMMDKSTWPDFDALSRKETKSYYESLNVPQEQNLFTNTKDLQMGDAVWFDSRAVRSEPPLVENASVVVLSMRWSGPGLQYRN